ncbi:hypothetical protein BHM03_00035226, partial [Ensete ventricosum]
WGPLWHGLPVASRSAPSHLSAHVASGSETDDGVVSFPLTTSTVTDSRGGTAKKSTPPPPHPDELRPTPMALLLQLPHSACCGPFTEWSDRLAALSSPWIRVGGSLRRVATGPAAASKGTAPRELVRISAMADQTVYKMNLNEYMVTLEKPMGIRFALSVDGRIFVHSLKKGVLPSFPYLPSRYAIGESRIIFFLSVPPFRL